MTTDTVDPKPAVITNPEELVVGPKESIIFLKLMTGEAIVCKTDDDNEDSINEKGFIEVNSCLRVRMELVGTEDGLTEILVLSPWLEGAYSDMIVQMPNEHILAVSRCKAMIAVKYKKFLYHYQLKEVQQDEAIQEAMEIEARRGQMHQTEGNKPMNPSMMIPPNMPPREPERLTAQRMYESWNSGEHDDEDDECDGEEQNPDEFRKPTFH